MKKRWCLKWKNKHFPNNYLNIVWKIMILAFPTHQKQSEKNICLGEVSGRNLEKDACLGHRWCSLWKKLIKQHKHLMLIVKFPKKHLPLLSSFYKIEVSLFEMTCRNLPWRPENFFANTFKKGVFFKAFLNPSISIMKYNIDKS